MGLRKVHLYTTTLQDNAVSWVNETDRKLYIKKISLRCSLGAGAVLGDIADASIDEVPVGQQDVNNSRSHIMGVRACIVGGTGAITGPMERATERFAKGELVLEPDEAVFLNTTDVNGAPPFAASCNIWYDD